MNLDEEKFLLMFYCQQSPAPAPAVKFIFVKSETKQSI